LLNLSLYLSEAFKLRRQSPLSAVRNHLPTHHLARAKQLIRTGGPPCSCYIQGRSALPNRPQYQLIQQLGILQESLNTSALGADLAARFQRFRLASQIPRRKIIRLVDDLELRFSVFDVRLLHHNLLRKFRSQCREDSYFISGFTVQ
jgi:hypothetical protein